MSANSDQTWSAETIKELLCTEQTRPLSHTPLVSLPSRPPFSDTDAKSDSTASEVSLARRKLVHRKVSAKDRFMRKGESEGVSMPNISGNGGSELINAIADMSQAEFEAEKTLEAVPTADSGRTNVYGRYSMQQKKAILGELKGRIDTIESSILSAKSALQNIIRFL